MESSEYLDPDVNPDWEDNFNSFVLIKLRLLPKGMQRLDAENLLTSSYSRDGLFYVRLKEQQPHRVAFVLSLLFQKQVHHHLLVKVQGQAWSLNTSWHLKCDR